MRVFPTSDRSRSAPPGAPRPPWLRWIAGRARRHPIRAGLFTVVVIVLALVLPSLVPALTRPGSDPTSNRLAEWARTHGFSTVLNFAERVRYDLHPPKVGGRPKALPPLAHAHTGATAVHTNPRALALPRPIAPVASPPLAGEGQWHVLATAAGVPAMAAAFVRPDSVHTSYVSGVVWINPKAVIVALHPGTIDPGPGTWGQPSELPARARAGLLAAFNGGFRLYASQGGYYQNGRTAVPLRDGAASFVIYTDGTATVGQWGRDVGMTPRVAAVRQNLDLIVDHGAPVPGLLQNVEQHWGATLGNAYYVWRSAVGVRPDGSLVYATGNSLSVYTLAQLLVRAGCVSAMELDINPEWTSFVVYHPGANPADPTPQNLLPDMQPSPQRYYEPMSRDFFSVYARP